MQSIVDLRSDTVTKPCAEMRAAMAAAEVGDDVYGEDPTINRLEELAAETLGKEAALYVVSGTMGNLLGVLSHTERGSELILGGDSHIYWYEVGGMSALGGVFPRPLYNTEARMTPELLRAAWRAEDIHLPKPDLVCLENTSNRGGGVVTALAEIEKMCEDAHAHDCKVHLDGARVFNAATYLGMDVKELVRPVDSLMFCLSKGLGAPVGSILAGERAFIDKARKLRKMVGGGMRQAGILAAAGLFSLENLVDRLADDHRRAQDLAKGMAKIPGVMIDFSKVQTNILMVDFAEELAGSVEIVEGLRARGILAGAAGEKRIRFVTHRDVDDEGVERTIEALGEVLA